MPWFAWTGITPDGSNTKGVLNASSPEQLHTMLLAQGIAVLTYKESGKHATSRWQWRVQSSQTTLLYFFENSHLLLSSGMHLAQAIDILTQQAHGSLHTQLEAISQCIHQGLPLYQALKQSGLCTSPIILAIIQSAEQTGTLPQTLLTLTDYLTQQELLKKALRQAAAGPLFTLGISATLTWGIVTFLLPHLAQLYQSSNTKLPTATALLFKISGFFGSVQGTVTVTTVITILVLTIFLARKRQWPGLSWFTTQIPLIGSIMTLKHQSTFFYTVHLFLHKGLHLLDALHGLQQSMPLNQQPMYQALIKAITEGKPLHSAMELASQRFFTPDTTAIIAVAEQADSLDSACEKLARHKMGLLTKKLNLLTTFFTPLLTLLVGFIIAGIMLTLYLPLFSLGSMLKM